MWKGKQGSKSSDRAILVSIRHFQRLQNLIQDLGAHVSMNNKITRADSLASVRNFIEQDNHWAAGQEMSRFLDFYGKVNDDELRWFASYQNYIHQMIKEHIISSVANSINDARIDFHIVATTSLGAYHNSKILQIHLLAIRDWMRRAAFLLAIIKKGKKEVRTKNLDNLLQC
ncbi:hypothetical protein PPACK8108_LOCUS26461 [Phakopsora pachyrhizi]|uniref:Uncharacterized protein n=1 Tax=Phakopsora pachyrhizi TaxID=170000 RepID=A0AAV0BTQ3_PHAPC|nr:hypothetical protein PPACK8108_LOCUS26461 [Phakopsora pachyrhizi]